MRRAALGRVRVGKRRRAIAWSTLALVAFLLLVTVPPALAARSRMEIARQQMVEGQELLLAGQPAEAAAAFDRARNGFESARSVASTPGLRAVGMIPLLGRTSDALRGLAEIGTSTAEAGGIVADGLATLPGGTASLAPQRGRLPISTMQDLSPVVSEATASLEEAQALADRLPDTLVPGQVASAVATTRERIGQALPLARSASGLLENLPAFAGAQGTRRYFVAGMNPAELRGTGGFIGVWSLLTIKDGQLSLERFNDIGDLQDLPKGQAERLDAELSYIYGDGISTSWKATNQTPDAPTAAGFIEDLWVKSHGKPLDGVIFMDPQALALMLGAAGPVRSHQLGINLSEDNVVPFVTNEVYFRLDGSAQDRKDALGIVAESAWKKFLTSAPPAAAVDAMVQATSGGHIVIHSTDEDVQEAFRAAGITGEWRETPGDFFGTVVNNAAGNKVDYYTSRSMALDISLDADRSAETRALISTTNSAPRNAQPNEALGPYASSSDGKTLGTGENLSILQTYCSSRCQLGSATIDDSDMTVSQAQENGLTVFISSFATKPKQSREIDYELETPDAWQGNGAGGTYRLHLDSQLALDPVQGSVVIHLPPGMRVVDASDNLTFGSSQVTWSGQIGPGVDVWVRFAKPPVQGALTRVWEFLTSSVG